MAKKSKIVKNNKKPKFEIRHRNRCSLCGRPRAYIRKFGICRMCFRELAHRGEIPGAKKTQISVPFSKFKYEIAKVLESEKFVAKVAKDNNKIMIDLSYEGGKPKITDIKRVSKLGLRVYEKGKNIKKIKGGRGILVISTSKGLMTGQDAKEKKLGGEVICQVW